MRVRYEGEEMKLQGREWCILDICKLNLKKPASHLTINFYKAINCEFLKPQENFEENYRQYLKYHASAPDLRLVTFYELELLKIARAAAKTKGREFMRILDNARARAGIQVALHLLW